MDERASGNLINETNTSASLKIRLRPPSPLSHLFLLSRHMDSNWKRRETCLLFQRHGFNHPSSRISVHTHWIICHGPFKFLLSTLRITHAASCEVVSFSHKEPRPQTLRHGTI